MLGETRIQGCVMTEDDREAGAGRETDHHEAYRRWCATLEAAGHDVETLFGLALAGEPDDPKAEAAVTVLRGMGSEAVFARAAALVRSAVAAERACGLAVLAQFGFRLDEAEQRGPERVALALGCLGDVDADVVAQAVEVVGQVERSADEPDGAALARVAASRSHPSAKVRLAVARALAQHATAEAVEGLIALMADADGEVRDWATFGLQHAEADSPAIRAALRARLSDPAGDTALEALWGLARRGDREGLSLLAERFDGEELRAFDDDAACRALGLEVLPEDDAAVAAALRRAAGLG